MSQITRGREMASQRRVSGAGVCCHAAGVEGCVGILGGWGWKRNSGEDGRVKMKEKEVS